MQSLQKPPVPLASVAMPAPPLPQPDGRSVRVAAACAGLILFMVVLAWLAVQGKSPTMDEPLHAVGAFLHVFHRDYRVNPEDPPLWNYLAMLPHNRGSLELDFLDPAWRTPDDSMVHQSTFTSRTLFHSVNDGVTFIQPSRAAMLVLPALLAGVLAWWSWRIAGATAAIAATALYCLDPNFLAHAPLVKNDVAISLLTLALAATTWGVGRRLTWWNAPLPGLLCGIGMSVKFSGVLLPPMLMLMLLVRAFLRSDWMILGRNVRKPSTRLLIATALAALSCILAWATVWAAYGFRFDATPAPGSRMPIEQLANGFAAHVVLCAERNHLLPQPWLFGLLFTYRSTLERDTFLLGELSTGGWWYYFPLAMVFKTPLATLAAVVVALSFWIISRRRGDRIRLWTTTCLLIPVLIYGCMAITTSLNLGIRHILVIYPFIYILIGVGVARLREVSPRAFRPIVIALALGLAVESLAAFPDYIPFFNAIARSSRLRLLSDSNLDWGQDLPALAHWQARHPFERLCLAYFGSTDPATYGIKYVNLPGGYFLGPPPEWVDPRSHGVLAISATRLQGVNMSPRVAGYYAPLRQVAPREILGGSIYLFDLPLPEGIELEHSP